MKPSQIRLATLDDIPAYYEHMKRHGKESGKTGDTIFAPYEEPWDHPFDSFAQEKEVKWQRPIIEIGCKKEEKTRIFFESMDKKSMTLRCHSRSKENKNE